MESQEISKLKSDIEEFEEIFNTYYTFWLEFFSSKYKENDISQLAHPGLEDTAIKLQVCFLSLPEILQQRLFALDFEIFLHCDNSVDFYSFRDFAFENGRFYNIATISSRVDSEVKLAKMLADKNNFESYKLLPKRKFDFYRTKKERSLLTELNELIVEKEEKTNDSNLQEDNEQIIDNKQSKVNNEEHQNDIVEPKEGLFAKINKIIKSGNEIVDAGSSMVTKTMPGIQFLIDHIL
jgi:hypothetical protein